MATTPVNFGAVGSPTSGMGNSTSNYIPMPPMTNGSGQNPAGVQGGSTTASGVPMMNYGANAVSGNGGVTGSPVASNPVAGGASGTLSGLTGTIGSGSPGGSIGTSSATGQNGQVDTGGQQTQRQDNRTLGELQSAYGEGMGSYIYNLMQTGGINLQELNQVDTSLIAADQPQINQGEANLNSVLGAQGISGNSSASALANSNYLSQATTQENSQIAQEYNQQYTEGQQLLSQILGQTIPTQNKETDNAPGILDDISEGLNLVGSIAGAGLGG